MLTAAIAKGKKRVFSVLPADSHDRAAPVADSVEWDVLPAGGVSLWPSADGLTCEVVAEAVLQAQVLSARVSALGQELIAQAAVVTI